jgi:Zn-dependent protease with chaperone function
LKLELRIAVVALLLLLFAPFAAGSVGSPSGVPSELAEPPGIPMVSAPEPVPVPEPDAKAIAYYESGNRLWAFRQLWNLAVPLFVLLSGLSVRMRTLAARLAPHWIGTVVVFALLYRVFDWIVSRPLGFYGAYLRPHAYGLSNLTFEKWLTDSVITLGVSGFVSALVVLGLYTCIRKFPRRWWLAVTVALVPFTLFSVLIQPLWVAPLYNDFGPMQDKTLEQKILGLADRSGIEGSRVFEVNKSVETKTVNAYVTGFLASKRIVLWDTLVERLDEDEVLFVMAHEMGHYVLNHVLLGVALATLLSGFGFYLLQRITPLLLRRWGDRFGVHRLVDVAAIPLLLVLIQLGSFAASPVALAVSRSFEHEADRFALELTQESRAGAMAFVKLQQTNLSIPRPGPLFVWWRASHPSLGDRIDFCNDYRPWQRGEPLRYGDRFR